MDTKPFVQALLEAGAHYGFTKTRRHPSTQSFIIATKNKTDLINLEATALQVEKAKEVLRGMAAGGKTVIIVGTKTEAVNAVNLASAKMQALSVVNRFVGGIITNFSEIRKRTQRLTTLRDEKSQGLLEKYTKKERLLLDREMEKMEKNFGGLVDMKRIPDIMVVVDPAKEIIAVTEARKMQIPVIAIANTDCDLTIVDYPIVMNDASKASIELVLNTLAEAYANGRA
jgi:small subunit ribosomal protein S2